LPSDARTDVEALRRVEADDTARLLDRLPTPLRTVIELSFYAGYSHTEIAGMLDVPLGTVKGRMRRGLEQIRIHMIGVAG
jgi:RNA polymerase sigma-70 factor (ECF subfamily)